MRRRRSLVAASTGDQEDLALLGLTRRLQMLIKRHLGEQGGEAQFEVPPTINHLSQWN